MVTVTNKAKTASTASTFADEALEQLRQLGTGAIELGSSLPWNVMASIPAAGWVLGNKLRTLTGKPEVPPPPEMMALLERGAKGTKLAESVTGAGSPESFGQSVARIAPGTVIPFGGPAASTMATLGTAAMVAATPELTTATTPKVAPPKNPLFDPTPMLDQPLIETVGGPYKPNWDEYQLLGYMGLASVGAMFAPAVFQRLRRQRTLTPVEAGPAGLMGGATRMDLFRTADDAAAGALRLARDIGVTPAMLDDMTSSFRINTRAGARSIADSAVKYGRAETGTARFRVQKSLADLSRVEDETIARYLHLRDTFDDLQVTKRPMVRGFDEPTVLRELTALEAARPELRAVGTAYRANLRELRRFESTGEFATLSRKNAKQQSMERPNYVPFEAGRVLDQPVKRNSPTHTMASELQSRIIGRLQNEARGRYIDTVRRTNPSLFKKVTRKQASDNPHWSTVRILRRGKEETWATEPFLADVLKFDPHVMSNIGSAITSTKRLFEQGTTAALAPWFTATSAIRSHLIGKFTSGDWKTTTIPHTIAAIPQQLVPQAARAISGVLDRNGWLGNVFGQGTVNAVSARLANVFDQSFFARLEAAGSGRGSILQQQVRRANTALDTVTEAAPAAFRGLLSAYKALLNAGSNAPAFGFAYRNRRAAPMQVVAERTRALTGDPRIGGERYTASGRVIRGPVSAEQPTLYNRTVGRAADWAIDANSMVHEASRAAVPWFNYTVQGVKRLGEAYLKNPVDFVAKAWIYAGLPAVVQYAYSAALGPEYLDHMMNRRSQYNRMMNFYIPVPGRPPEEGIEFPVFHEMSGVKAMMEVAIDHLTRSNVFNLKEDMANVASNFLGVVNPFVMPPLGAAAIASTGNVPPGNVFGGEAYRPRNEPFDQRDQGLDGPLELVFRALGGGIADVVGQGYAAMMNSEEDFLGKLAAGAGQAGLAMVKKTPILRDIVNERVPMSGDTRITQEMFKKQGVLRELTDYYRTWTKNEGTIDPKLRSKEGESALAPLLDEAGLRLPTDESGDVPTAGLGMPEPTNPLYKQFMLELYQNFATDSTANDVPGVPRTVVGFMSLWNLRGDYTRLINDIKPVDAGNYPKWQAQLEKRPAMIAYLKENGVNYKNPTTVRNWFTKKRQDIDTVILGLVRRTEASIGERLGAPFTIDDVKPYK